MNIRQYIPIFIYAAFEHRFLVIGTLLAKNFLPVPKPTLIRYNCFLSNSMILLCIKTKIFQKIIEKFHRNRKKSANEDIAEQDFILSDDKIHVRYHRHDPNITASTREFFIPPNLEDKAGNLNWTSDMTTTFQVYTSGLRL